MSKRSYLISLWICMTTPLSIWWKIRIPTYRNLVFTSQSNSLNSRKITLSSLWCTLHIHIHTYTCTYIYIYIYKKLWNLFMCKTKMIKTIKKHVHLQAHFCILVKLLLACFGSYTFVESPMLNLSKDGEQQILELNLSSPPKL